MFDKLKQRWNIQSNLQLVLVLLVFAITGTLTMKLTYPILRVLGIRADNFGVFYYIIKLIALFPIYQILLLLTGKLLGQFRFFWAFEKRMLESMRLGKLARYLDSKWENQDK